MEWGEIKEAGKNMEWKGRAGNCGQQGFSPTGILRG